MTLIRTAAAALAVAALATAGCRPGPKRDAAGNRPPSIAEARIQPEQPSVDAQLSLKINCIDPDGDQISYRVEWTVNGAAKSYSSGLTMSTKGLDAGDRIWARILPSDGLADGEWYTTDAVQLWPRIDAIDSLRLEPSPLTAGLENIAVRPHVSGAARPEERIVYKWTLEGKTLADSGNAVSVPPLRIGQKLVVEATPVLGAERGKPFRIMATVVGAPPVVRSIDYVSQDSLGYVYRIEAEDPNSETLTFSLVKAPPGAGIDSKNGTITIPLKALGQEIRVRVANQSGSWVERRLEASP